MDNLVRSLVKATSTVTGVSTRDVVWFRFLQLDDSSVQAGRSEFCLRVLSGGRRGKHEHMHGLSEDLTVASWGEWGVTRSFYLSFARFPSTNEIGSF